MWNVSSVRPKNVFFSNRLRNIPPSSITSGRPVVWMKCLSVCVCSAKDVTETRRSAIAEKAPCIGPRSVSRYNCDSDSATRNRIGIPILTSTSDLDPNSDPEQVYDPDQVYDPYCDPDSTPTITGGPLFGIFRGFPPVWHWQLWHALKI